MGIQKYRADEAGEKCENGSVPWYAKWVGGPSLALVKDCPVELATQVGPAWKYEYKREPLATPKTVYVTGEAYTWDSLPAACKIKGRTVRGSLSRNEQGYIFTAYKSAEASEEV